MLVTRNCFAREELHKVRVHPADRLRAECAWCGAVEINPLRTDGRPQHRIYRFEVQSDGGRVSVDRETFCARTCRAAYLGL